MVFHVRIRRKTGSTWDREYFELDFTRTMLQKQIVEPYLNGTPFICGGHTVDPFDVSEIKINETSQNSSQLMPTIRARKEAERRRSKVAVVTGTPDEWYVTEEGTDVTRKFIIHPPKPKAEKKTNATDKKKKKTKRRKLLERGIIGLVVLLVGLDLTYCVVIPLSDQPKFTIDKTYDFERKFFPEELNFYPDSASNGYIVTVPIHLVKMGERPGLLHVAVKESDFLNRPYGIGEFVQNSEAAGWAYSQGPALLRIEFLENSSLNNFTIDIECGLRYFIYPFFGIQNVPLSLESSVSYHCKYVKDNEHNYRWLEENNE
jgi:hypothetical protein